MYWGLTLFSISLTIGTLTTLVLAYLGWTRRRDVGASPFILMMLAVSIWSLAYTFELNTPIIEAKLFWHKVSYAGIPYVSVCWILFNAQVLGYGFAFRLGWLVVLSILPVCITILTWTLEYHSWIWGEFSLTIDQGLVFLDFVRNDEFYIYAGYSYVLLALGTLFFVRILLQSPSFRLPLVGILAFGVILSIILNMLQIIFEFEISIPFDLSPLTLAIIGGSAGWCVFRFGPLDVLSVARVALLENISEGFIVLGMSGRIISINSAAQKMIRIEEEPALGLTLDQLMPSEYRYFDPKTGDEVKANWVLEVNKETSSILAHQTHYELLLPCEGDVDGELYIDLSVNRLFDQRDRVRGMLLVLRDISQRKRTQQALMQAQRMESAGVLAGGVAHDFNNLLAAIKMRHQLALKILSPRTSESPHVMPETHRPSTGGGDLALALQTIGLDESEQRLVDQVVAAQRTAIVQPIARHIHIAGKALDRAADLTRQLLAYTGKGRFKVEPVDINRLIEENRALLATAVSKKIELLIDLSPQVLLVDADQGQLQQVIMNLLLNAADAMENLEGGTIEVQTALRDIDLDEAQKYIWKDSPQPGVYIHLRIKDGGVGMSAEVQSRIFEPFYTTKVKGRGLGLSAVLGAIHLYNGGIQVSSKPNAGSVFQALFPVSESASHRRELSGLDDKQAEPVHLNATVLVADDELPVLEVLAEILADAGLHVLTATNGHEALEIFRARQEQIDFVLLDSKMPIMGGIEALSAMRQLSPHLCALLSSGYSEEEVSQSVTWDAQTDFLQKPYDMEVLIDKVEQLSKHGQRLNEF